MGLFGKLFRTPYEVTDKRAPGSPGLPSYANAIERRGLGGALERFANPTSGIGKLGDALLYASGAPIGHALMQMQQQRLTDQQQQRQQERDAAEDEYRRQMLEARQQPQGRRLFQRRDGSIIAVDEGTLDVTPLDTPAVSVPEPLQSIYDQSSPTGTRLVPRSQAVGKPTGKPSGAAKGYTPMQTSKIRAEAQAAIARGADPAAVRARLAEMGL